MINGTAHTGSEVDAQVLSQLIEFNKNKHLVIAGYKPDGKKIQKWMDGCKSRNSFFLYFFKKTRR